MERNPDRSPVPGIVTIKAPMEPCEKCGIDVCAAYDVDGSLAVVEVVQLGVVITAEQAANPVGAVAHDFRIQTMPHICPPAEIAAILRGEK